MPNQLAKTCFFFLIAYCLFFQSLHTRAQQKFEFLNDSVSLILNNPKIDSFQIPDLLRYVRNNRRNLKGEYLPILWELNRISKEIGYRKGLMQTYNYIGVCYRYNESFQKAIDCHKLGIALAEELNDHFFIMYGNNNLGQVYRKLDDNEASIKCFHVALKMAESVKDEYNIAIAQNSLGNAYVVQKDYNRALHYYLESVNYGLKKNKKKHLEICYGSIGELFLYMDQPDSAIYYIDKSAVLAEERGSKVAIAVCHQLQAQAYEQIGDYKKAMQLYALSLKEQRENKQERYVAFNLNFLGSLNIRLGEYAEAEKYLREALVVAKKIGSLDNEIKAQEAIFELNKKTENWEGATEALLAAEVLKDSVLNEKKFKAIQEMETRYETRIKEQKIELLTAENEIKNQRFLLLVAGTLIFLVLLLTAIYIRNKRLIMQREQVNHQLLRSQMNPHFIFNALGSIQNFMLKNEPRKAASYLGSFATLTRSVLEFSAVEKISLAQEVETLKSYIELEKMRMQDRFSYEIEVSDLEEAEFIEIPPMLIQPFVENAIKHGFRREGEGAHLRIEVKDNGNCIDVVIEDNGVGINSENKVRTKHRSMSMEIFNKRRKIIQKQFKKDFLLKVIDLSEEGTTGTRVTVSLPVLK